MSALFRVICGNTSPCEAVRLSILCRNTSTPQRQTAYVPPPPHGRQHVTATSTDTRTPPRHDCRHVSTSGRHVPHVLTSYTACRQRSNFHGNTSGRSSDTNTYHQRQTRHNHNRNTPEHVTTSNCRTRHTSTSTTRGHAATLRTSGNCRGTMERQHVTTSTRASVHRTRNGPHTDVLTETPPNSQLPPRTAAATPQPRQHLPRPSLTPTRHKKSPSRLFSVGGYFSILLQVSRFLRRFFLPGL